MLKIRRATPLADQPGKPGVVIQAGKTGIVVGCGLGALRIEELQREGGRTMAAAEFLAGHPMQPGDKLG